MTGSFIPSGWQEDAVMSDLYIPLDPRPDATEITPIDLLRSAEVELKIPCLTVMEIKSMKIDRKTYTIREIDFSNSTIATHFVVGDTMLKVNDTIPTTFVHLSKLLADSGDTTILIKRRAFVTPPGHFRVQAVMAALKLPVQKKMSYMVVTCKNTPLYVLSTSFGFTAENVNVTRKIKKLVVTEINGNTAPEEYFSVGDNLIDYHGLPFDNDGKILKHINTAFRTMGEIDVLIERPITTKNREATARVIKRHLEGGSSKSGRSSKSAAGKPIAEKKKVGSAAAPVAVAGGPTKDKSSKSAGKSSSSKRRSEKDKLKKEKSVDGSEKADLKRGVPGDQNTDREGDAPSRKKERLQLIH